MKTTCFALLLTLLAAAARAENPRALGCSQSRPKSSFPKQEFRLIRNDDGTYALHYSGVADYVFEDVTIADTVLADKLTCSFSGPTSQLLSCSQEETAADPNHGHSHGPRKHEFTVTETAFSRVEDGHIVVEKARNAVYKRSRSMWVDAIELEGKFPAGEKERSGRDEAVTLQAEGRLSIGAIAPDCFTY